MPQKINLKELSKQFGLLSAPVTDTKETFVNYRDPGAFLQEQLFND